MYVVLDTNIIYSDFHLKGAEIVSLCESIKQIGGKVCIPGVVMLETTNKYREELVANRKRVDKELNAFARLTDKEAFSNPITEEYTNCEAIAFEDYFEQRVKELGIKVLPIPTIPHEQVIGRDLARKKPFTSEGKGYRDTLIWESILKLCSQSENLFDPPVVFVNKNYKDFCVKDTYALHPDLKSDLVENGQSEDSVRIVPDISTVTKEYIKPTQEVLKKVITEFNEHKEYKGINLNYEVEKRTTQYLKDRSFDLEDNPLRSEFENPSITDVELLNFAVTDVRLLTEHCVLIDLVVQCLCSFDFYIFKADAAILDEEDMPSITDSDWNDHYMAASDTKKLSLSMSLIVNRAFTKIMSESITIEKP